MIEIQHEEIETSDGKSIKYKCQMMPATKSHRVLVELIDVMGRPALVAIATGVESKSSGELGVNVDAVVETATRILMERLTPDTADRLIKTILDGVEAHGVGPVHPDKVFDNHFRGQILHMYRVVAWSIRVNYRDFFCAASSSPTVSSLGSHLGEVLKQATAMLSSGPSSTQKED